MKNFRVAQSVFSVLLVAFLLGNFALNALNSLPGQWAAVEQMPTPQNPSEAKPYLTQVDNIMNGNVYGQTLFIETYAYLQVLMGKDESNNFDIVRAPNGETDYGGIYQSVDTVMLQECAMRMQRLDAWAQQAGSELLFVATPSMYTRGYSQYAPGIPASDSNQLTDTLLYYLHSYGVDTLDIRTVLANSALPPRRFIYNTDHHWTVEAGFEAFRALVQTLNTGYGAGLDPDGFYCDAENYSWQEYPGAYLGTLGRRAGIPFAGVDDFTLIWPGYETDYTLDYLQRGSEQLAKREGAFADALLDSSYFSTSNPYMDSIYTAYLGGSTSWKRITNHNNPDGPRVLMIHDSYALPMASFLAGTAGSIDMIWPFANVYEEGDGFIDGYLQENQFDYIIVMLYPGNYNTGGFNFMAKG